MRRAIAVGVVVFGLVGLAWADDGKAAQEVIDKAIKAHGGADKLAKLKMLSRKEVGKYHGLGAPFPYTAHTTLDQPGKMRQDIEGVYLAVLDGDKGWMQANGETKELTKQQLDGTKAERYVEWLTTLVPLTGKDVTVTALADAKVNDQPAAGVQVTSKGRPTVSLYFDKKTGLLVKSQYKARAAEKMDEEVNQETVYSQYKDVAGVQVPMKVVTKRDGELYIEGERSEVKLVEKHDKDVFAKP